jgi:hypothetical protein
MTSNSTLTCRGVRMPTEEEASLAVESNCLTIAFSGPESAHIGVESESDALQSENVDCALFQRLCIGWGKRKTVLLQLRPSAKTNSPAVSGCPR